MDLMNQVQILDEVVYISLGANTIVKGMNPSLLTSAMGK